MSQCLFQPRLIALVIACASLSATAQSLTTQLDPVVVTAQRVAQNSISTLSDVSVIERNDIVQSGATNLMELLSTIPGIQAVSGPSGGENSVYVRGSESRMTMLLIDGVRVDAQDGTLRAGGGAPWEMLPLEMIERIEVLRGPASTVYGADAVGGVVQVFTKKAKEGQISYAEFEVGSRDTTRSAIGTGYQSEKFSLSGAVSGFSTAGYDPAPTIAHTPRQMGERSESATFNAIYSLDQNQQIKITHISNDRHLSTIWSSRSQMRLVNDGLAYQGRLLPSLKLSLNYGSSLVSVNDTSPTSYDTLTNQMTASLEKQSAWGVWLVNIDQRTDDFHQKQYAWGETPFNNQRDRNGKGVGWLLDRGSNHLTARVRQDKDDLFGSKNTSSIAYGYGGDLGWRTVVSVASSYRVPTLEQLYSDYGLITLRPEMGKHWELSIRRVQSGQRTELTAYRSRLKDMITPDSFGIVGNCAATQFCYRNVDEVEIRGVTFSHETQWDRIHGKLSFDWLKPIDLSTGKLLNMRAKESLSFVAQYDADDWVHSISLKAIGRRYSSKNEKNPLPGYATIDVASRKLLSKNSQAWIKVSNLFDKRVKVSDLYMNGVDFLYAPPTTLTLGIRKNFD